MPRMDSVRAEVAAAAARLVVEEGLEYGPAKQRAARALGLGGRAVLPDNDALEDAVRDYLALFCADTQPNELRVLRQLALQWMQRLDAFRPHLGGAVWRGTATRLSDIYIQLFCDDSKAAELALIDQGVRYEVRSVSGFHGERVDALSVQVRCAELGTHVGVHLLVYDYDDLRGALKPDARGLRQRGSYAELHALVHDTAA